MNFLELQPPPLSLYVHLPWCESKCPYCDFNSHPLKTALPEQEYIKAICVDLESEAEAFKDRELRTIFFGGGTPSLFSSSSIKKILECVGRLAEISKQLEVTIEANPSSSEIRKFDDFLAAGVNRLSLGAQSFSDKQLCALGRLHNSEAASSGILAAQQAGFKNINIDLMFGLPNQTKNEALNDLHIALSFEAPHISLYQLTIEPNTYFSKYPPLLPTIDTDWEIRTAIYNKAKERGYHRYEVSAFSKTGYQCQHNLNVWGFGDYIGVGAGAHGKTTSVNGIFRYSKEKHPSRYIDKALSGASLASKSAVAPKDLCFEFMLNALRLKKGFQLKDFTRKTGVSWSFLFRPLAVAQNKGLLEINGSTVCATSLGYRFLDDLIELFLP